MSILSFRDIKQNNFFDLTKFLKNNERYLAHLSKDEAQKETLIEHSNLVLEYALKLIEAHNIEKTIENINFLSNKNYSLQNDIKLFFLKAIYWHDIGKINENFQIEKMKNNSFSKRENGISSKHSILGAYLYLASCFSIIEKKDENIQFELVTISLIFALTIWRHHTGIDKSINEFLTDKDEGLISARNLNIYLNQINIDKNAHKLIFDFLVYGDLSNYLIKNENYYFLSKLLFSLLIIADYYATAQFMNYGNKKKLVYNDFGLINDEFRNKIYKEFYKNQFLEGIENKTESDFKSFQELQEKSNENLNHLRNKLFVEVKENLRKNIDKNLFYIEAPTGAGKTNLSIMSIVEILQKDKSINKVFYVFPFTTLITQTFNSIKKILNLKSDEIIELHSKAKYNIKKESQEDGIYGDERVNFLDNQFMNYPITMLSHIKFFDILTGVSKDDNYIFHRLANSIVIIDEIQTYNPKLWSKVVYLLDNFSKKFNIKFFVMSATLPKIGEITNSEFIFLVKNKKKYFQNPNFAKRVEINTDIIKIKEPKDIYKRVEKESKSYQEKKGKVKTIIEFITKKGADEFYQEARKKYFFDEVLLLSGTIIESRRKEIIEFLKRPQDKNILLVTTQVVEAGVDIDMDIGFKEKSLIDSDEQLAGRINRNSSKSDNKLFLFETKNPKAKIVYKDDKRLELKIEEDVLKTKDFDKYYNEVIKKIKEQNNTTFIENLNAYIDYIKNLRFKDVHKDLKTIDIESISIYVPLDEEALQTWKEYKALVENRELEFIKKQIEIKKLASKLSKYTFSLAKYQGREIENLQAYCIDKEYGFLVIKPEHIAIDDADFDGNIIYTYKNGLDTKVLKGENVGIFI